MDCVVCDKTYKTEAGLNRHYKTASHKKKLDTMENNEVILSDARAYADSLPKVKIGDKVAASKDAQIASLLEMVKNLTEKVNTIEDKVPEPRVTSPFHMADVSYPKAKYSVNQILSRSGTKMKCPDFFWRKFISDGYFYEGKVETVIKTKWKNLNYGANLLISMFKSTHKEELPILVLNKKSGKIAYYETDDKSFITRTSIKGRTGFYNFLEIYLVRTSAQLWHEKKLRGIYRDLPIEIRDKMHYQSTERNHISFLNFYYHAANCNTNNKTNIDVGSYRQMIPDIDGNKIILRQNRELKKPSGEAFSLDGQDYYDFVEEYINFIHDHEDYETFKKYVQDRNDEEVVNMMATDNEGFKEVLDDVFDKICDICDINKIIN